MHSSSEIFITLLQVIGAVVGLAVFFVAVILIASHSPTRKALAWFAGEVWTMSRSLFGLLAERAFLKFHELADKGRQVARTFLT